MKRYNYKGFYGDYGYILVNNDGTAFLEMVIPGNPSGKIFRKTYKNFRAAKSALTRYTDSYTLTDVSYLLETK